MAINLSIALIAIVIAVGDPSFKPIPSYGENGVDWEAQKKLQERSDALGWMVRVERGSPHDGIHIRLTDRSGEPVTGASGNVRAYHFTRAGEAVTAKVIESDTQPGLYIAAVDVSKDGRWQITLSLEGTEGEEFFWDHDVEWYR